MAKKFRSILSLIFVAIFCFSSMGMASVALATEEDSGDVTFTAAAVKDPKPEEVKAQPNDDVVFSVARNTVKDKSKGITINGLDTKDYFQLSIDPWETYGVKGYENAEYKSKARNQKNRYHLPVNKEQVFSIMADVLGTDASNTKCVNEINGSITAYEADEIRSDNVEQVLKQLKDENGNTYLDLAIEELKAYFDNQELVKNWFSEKVSEEATPTDLDSSEYEFIPTSDNYGKDWTIDWYVMKSQNNGIHVDGVFVRLPGNVDPDPQTTEEPTTEEPTTEEPTTEEPTTEEPATEEPATEEPTTEEPATEEPATEEPTTEEPTTEEPTTEEPTTEEPASEEPATEEPAAEEPAAEEPANNNTQPSTPNYVPANYFYPDGYVPAVNNSETELDESEIPLSEMPELEEELEEDLIPLGDAPEIEEELEEDLVPLGDAPQTGDTAMLTLFAMLMLISAIALVALLCIARRESKKEKNR